MEGFKRRKLLGFNTNYKTMKNDKLGFYTGVLYLAPSDISGFQVCPMAKLAGCEKACLYSAGRGAFNNVQQARISKTQYYFNDRAGFMRNLVKDIEAAQKKADKLGQTLLIRLNGTSDIPWERVAFVDFDGQSYENIMDRFPEVQFYDYTKRAKRLSKPLPSNYDLTFSYSGVKGYEKQNQIALASKARIAVVFKNKDNIPAQFNGKQCITGDDSDVRHIEPDNCIVSLYAKGKAKSDTSGFVINN